MVIHESIFITYSKKIDKSAKLNTCEGIVNKFKNDKGYSTYVKSNK